MQMLDNDLAFLRASASVLEDYLLSNILYYPVTGEHGRQLSGDTTRLTPGNLLLSSKRLRAAGETNEPGNQLSTLLDQVSRVQGQWKSRWVMKVKEEIPNRIVLWRNYLNELGEEQPARAGDYPYNIRLRVILELLLDEVDDLLIAEKSNLASLDKRLKARGMPANFIWNSALEPAFPPTPYWYLYWQL